MNEAYYDYNFHQTFSIIDLIHEFISVSEVHGINRKKKSLFN